MDDVYYATDENACACADKAIAQPAYLGEGKPQDVIHM